MSHLSLEMLLSLREPGAEPGTSAAREHLDQCPQCQTELDRLHQRVARLKALPTLRPGRDRWPETAAKLRTERRRRQTRLVGLSGLGLAASLALVLGIDRKPQPTDATTTQLSEAMVQSQALESALSAYNPEARVLDGRTARMAEELEDRIARVDRALEATELLRQQARDEELLRLWRERVGLLDALVDVHLTRASNAGL
jgi:DNA repair exonuclease SbcCD ATPase subunit